MENPMITRFRQNEAIQFFENVDAIITKAALVQLQDAQEVNAYKVSLAIARDSFKPDLGSAFTDTLNVLDDKRDALEKCLLAIATAYSMHYDEKISEPANLVKKEIKKYGPSIHRLSYQAETSAIISLCNTLQNDAKLKQAVKTIKATDIVNDMAAINTEFDTVYLERNKELAEKEAVNTSEQLATVFENYTALVNYIFAITIMQKTPESKSLLAQIEGLVEKYNAEVVLRMSRGNSENEVEAADGLAPEPEQDAETSLT